MNQLGKLFSVVVGLAICLTGLRLIAATPEMQAHYINVGQGACALLEFPTGAILVDTGAQDDDYVEHLVDYLSEFFQRRPDLNNTLSTVFITHPHIDHTKGLKRVSEICRIANYLMTESQTDLRASRCSGFVPKSIREIYQRISGK